MQDCGCQLSRIYLPRTSVNKLVRKAREAVAPALLTLVPFSSERLCCPLRERVEALKPVPQLGTYGAELSQWRNRLPHDERKEVACCETRFVGIRLVTLARRSRCHGCCTRAMRTSENMNSANFRCQGFSAPAADRFARLPPPHRWPRWSLARRSARTTMIRASPPSRHGGCLLEPTSSEWPSSSCRLSQLGSDSPAVTTASGVFPRLPGLPSLSVWVGARNSSALVLHCRVEGVSASICSRCWGGNSVDAGSSLDNKRTTPSRAGRDTPSRTSRGTTA